MLLIAMHSTFIGLPDIFDRDVSPA